MDKIIDYILNKKNCKFEDLQFFGAKYYQSTNLLQVVFASEKYDNYFQEKTEKLKQLVQEYTDNKFQVEVKIKNILLSDDYLFDILKKFINENPLYKTIFDIENSSCKLQDNSLIFTLLADIHGFEDEKEKFELEVEKLYSNYSLGLIFDYKNISRDY